MRKTDEQVNNTAYMASFAQYGDVRHEEYESTANGFIMGYNDAVNDMQLENEILLESLFGIERILNSRSSEPSQVHIIREIINRTWVIRDANK